MAKGHRRPGYISTARNMGRIRDFLVLSLFVLVKKFPWDKPTLTLNLGSNVCKRGNGKNRIHKEEGQKKRITLADSGTQPVLPHSYNFSCKPFRLGLGVNLGLVNNAANWRRWCSSIICCQPLMWVFRHLCIYGGVSTSGGAGSRKCLNEYTLIEAWNIWACVGRKYRCSNYL